MRGEPLHCSLGLGAAGCYCSANTPLLCCFDGHCVASAVTRAAVKKAIRPFALPSAYGEAGQSKPAQTLIVICIYFYPDVASAGVVSVTLGTVTLNVCASAPRSAPSSAGTVATAGGAGAGARAAAP